MATLKGVDRSIYENIDPLNPLGPPVLRASYKTSNFSFGVDRSGYMFEDKKALAIPEGWCERGPVEEAYTQDGQQVTRYFIGPWGNRHPFLEWALGYSYVQETGSPGGGPSMPAILKRVIPAQDPERLHLWCRSCELVDTAGALIQHPGYATSPGIIGLSTTIAHIASYVDSGSGAQDQWGKAVYRCVFQSLPFEVYNDDDTGHELIRFVERQEVYGIQTLALPGAELKFAEGPPLIKHTVVGPSAMTKFFPFRQFRYIWYDVPGLSEAAVDSCMGKINLSPFDLPWTYEGILVGGFRGVGFEPETLLCQNIEKRIRTSVTGRKTMDITFSFMYRPETWNKFPANDGGMYLATGTGPGGVGGSLTGERIYKTAAFDSLFDMPTSLIPFHGPKE